jgi:type IV pilus assembly protein PilA
MRKQKGFSLIELLIVVAIILIIAAIAIPNLLKAKMSAADSAAAATIRALDTAQLTYSINYPGLGFADTFTKLGPNAAPPLCDATGACLIDSVLAATATGPNTKGAYKYYLVGGAALDFTVSAEPSVMHSSGNNVFCSSGDAVIKSQVANPAVASGGPVTTALCNTVATYAALKN